VKKFFISYLRNIVSLQKDLAKEFIDEYKNTKKLRFVERWLDRLIVLPFFSTFFIFSMIIIPIIEPLYMYLDVLTKRKFKG
jgi:hypothetical protein